MEKRTIPPALARMMVADDDAIVGAAQMVFCDHEDKPCSVFGGASLDLFGAEGGNWEKVVGTMIFVPVKRFIWHDGQCGWTLEDLVVDGMEPRFWEEKRKG